ncbi:MULTISPECIES: acyl carrier protein [unclassified Burkholderia]|uniref:acyl carrier protein n=1 Tax=unclassified Burkholderia TaxID=2613784 RepID=UPI000F57337A|nr:MULTISPECIES: acyl carrier protein [unclassified Burkholderia]RQR87685.1 acyl carrier protein [Burkholderia sp. Bp9011]RQR97032.1 acyl carrier protein [Burkholderia sp. Bp9010]
MSTNQQSNIEERVKERIAYQMGLNASAIENNASFVNDLSCDSLDVVEIIMDVEDEFGFAVPDEDAEQIVTVQQAIDYVTAKVAA